MIIEMSKDPEFSVVVGELIKKNSIDEIVETGAYQGRGSTLVFARTGLPVYSIECNPVYYEAARNNLKDYPKVTILHGYSLKQADILAFIRQDNIYKTHPELKVESRELYIKESSVKAPAQDLLEEMINNNKRQIVFLDSTGGAGYLEFKKFINLPKEMLKEKILMMDDIDHVKHYRSVKYLESLGYKVNYSKSKRWGWCDIF
jgi:hypothetical protein